MIVAVCTKCCLCCFFTLSVPFGRPAEETQEKTPTSTESKSGANTPEPPTNTKNSHLLPRSHIISVGHVIVKQMRKEENAVGANKHDRREENGGGIWVNLGGSLDARFSWRSPYPTAHPTGRSLPSYRQWCGGAVCLLDFDFLHFFPLFPNTQCVYHQPADKKTTPQRGCAHARVKERK